MGLKVILLLTNIGLGSLTVEYFNRHRVKFTIATKRLFKTKDETTFSINNSALYFQARIEKQEMTCVWDDEKSTEAQIMKMRRASYKNWGKPARQLSITLVNSRKTLRLIDNKEKRDNTKNFMR